jgi:hypothetical protein
MQQEDTTTGGVLHATTHTTKKQYRVCHHAGLTCAFAAIDHGH